MSFDRNRAQIYIENIVGCNNFKDFCSKDISNITLDRSQAFSLIQELQEDAKDFYYKGCLSLTESLTAYSKRHYSWAVVKNYYAAFYFTRADLALKKYALFRHKKGIYYIFAREHEQIKRSQGRDYSTDHKAAFNYFKDIFPSDIFLSQEIEDTTSYNWLMKKREQVNYQERYFCEPSCSSFLEYIDNRIQAGEFESLLEDIYNDNALILTFQPEYAPIAIPLRRAILTKQNFANNNVSNILTQDKIEYLKTFSYPFF